MIHFNTLEERMEKKFILTAFGKDRPGIVADVSEVVYENGCNLEDSTMTRLADEFTLILLVSGQEGELEENLVRECRRLEREKGLSAFIRPVETEPPPSPKGFTKRDIHVEGLDQAGIVYRISKYLAGQRTNIENLKSRRSCSPQFDSAIYTMEIETMVPDAISAEDLEKALDRIGGELNVEITVN
jgi:glycine cleavage system transcriptional repressor